VARGMRAACSSTQPVTTSSTHSSMGRFIVTHHCQFGVAVTSLGTSPKLLDVGQFSTGMGDRLEMGKPPQYFTKPPRPTQPPTLGGIGNVYQPKCGDALQLESKGRYGSFHLWINGVGGR